MAKQCNKCFYDMEWGQVDGQYKPFEPGTQTPHQHRTPPRPGWGIGPTGKPAIVNPTILSDADKHLLSEAVETPQAQARVDSAVMGKGQQQLSVSPADVQPQIIELLKQIEALKILFTQAVQKQNQDIADIKAIVNQYTEHNPFASMFSNLVDKLISYLPDSELKPKTADELL